MLDVNFINHYKTSGFLFFNDKEDAKKTDNSVVKVKGCLIHAEVLTYLEEELPLVFLITFLLLLLLSAPLILQLRRQERYL